MRDSQPTPTQELLHRVVRRGHQLRWRRRLGIAAAAVATVAVIATGAGMAVLREAPDESVGKVAAEPTSTPGEGEDPKVSSPSAAPDPVPATQPPSTEAPACRDSTNPDCGPFYWDPEPPKNQPMTVTVVAEPAQAKVGETVTFRVRVADDSNRRPNISSVNYGDGTGLAPGYACEELPKRYGPWTPPPPDGKPLEKTYEHAYESEGSYTARFEYFTTGLYCDTDEDYVDPYGSSARGSVTIKVTS